MPRSEFTTDCIRVIGMFECLKRDEACQDYYARIAKPHFEDWGLKLKKNIEGFKDGVELFKNLSEKYE